MKYKCENELHTLSFKDFSVDDIKLSQNKLTIYTNGGVARYDNSCNETLEERYISECEIQFINADIEKFFLEGGRYLDANDVLIREEPDKDVEKSNYKEAVKQLNAGTIFFLSGKSDNGKYIVEFAVDLENNDTYWMTISCEKLIVGFDRFMNRVMN